MIELGGVTITSADLPAKQDFHLFLLAGQSNMAGRGKVTPVDRYPDPNILMLDRDAQWVPATDPVHFDKSVAGVGLGRGFAKGVRKRASGRDRRSGSLCRRRVAHRQLEAGRFPHSDKVASLRRRTAANSNSDAEGHLQRNPVASRRIGQQAWPSREIQGESDRSVGQISRTDWETDADCYRGIGPA